MITPKDRPEPRFRHPNRQEGKRPDYGTESGQINRKPDLDGDGALSFEEFRNGPAVMNLTEDEQEDRFELIDRNVMASLLRDAATTAMHAVRHFESYGTPGGRLPN